MGFEVYQNIPSNDIKKVEILVPKHAPEQVVDNVAELLFQTISKRIPKSN